MRDRSIITSFTLAIVLISIVSSAGAFSTIGAHRMSDLPAATVSAPTPATTVSTTTTDASSSASPTTTTAMPTIVQQTLSSETVVQPVSKPGNGIGHAYGIFKRASTTPVVMIVDAVTITSVQGTIPGQMDSIGFNGYYSSVQYCSQTAIFDPASMTTYAVTFMCVYKGAGTYNFSVQVYDQNQTLIGTSL